tara:strand:- start:772 stop:921 length:150 start_codon:yes stop_codon:yes gene_type:complete
MSIFPTILEELTETTAQLSALMVVLLYSVVGTSFDYALPILKTTKNKEV